MDNADELDIVLLNYKGDVVYSWALNISNDCWKDEIVFLPSQLREKLEEYLKSIPGQHSINQFK